MFVCSLVSAIKLVYSMHVIASCRPQLHFPSRYISQEDIGKGSVVIDLVDQIKFVWTPLSSSNRLNKFFFFVRIKSVIRRDKQLDLIAVAPACDSNNK
ncbi:hypothetical protein CDAR_252401 [Caerostris darwini]|uniref:Secreted protein n=1 Tax=Caerostris darwini TaxID=1538125 RepID=A0AAV4WK24_9ARAC|nr:hypothetical protein CDAR_252401 [Caerostris darwini]